MSAIEEREYEHIEIRRTPGEIDIGGFSVLLRKHGTLLGQIRRWPFLPEYCFLPLKNRVISLGCMKDICSFVEELMEERKK